MPNIHYSRQEVAVRGAALYGEKIRANVETPENIGKIVAIDIETGDYEVDVDILKAAKRLHEKRPDALLWGERIGYDSVMDWRGATPNMPSK